MKKIYKIQLFLFLLLIIGFSCEDKEEPNLIVFLDPVVTPVSSFGGSDGSVSIEFKGGNPPFEFFLIQGDLLQTPVITEINDAFDGNSKISVSNLSQGDYTISVIYDEGQSVARKSFSMQQAEAEDFTFNFDVTEPTKNGYRNGAINLIVGNGVEPYKYKWVGFTDRDTTPKLENILVGTYTVEVEDSRGVKQSATVEVTEPEFTCGIDSVMDVDGNIYPTIELNGQCWISQNLKTMHKPNSTFEYVDNIYQPVEEIEGRFCSGSNCLNEKGAHYTWQGAMNGTEPPASDEEYVQGVCPTGWHIPNRSEWEALNGFLAVDGNGGTGTNVPKKMIGATSSSGFDALLIGNWGYNLFSGDIAAFWTSTEYKVDGVATDEAYYRILNTPPIIFGEGHADKQNGLSIRCVKD